MRASPTAADWRGGERVVLTNNAALAFAALLSILQYQIENQHPNKLHCVHTDRQMWISLKKGTAVWVCRKDVPCR